MNGSINGIPVMKKKYRSITIMALLGVLLTGCRKEMSEVNAGPGASVDFGATTLWQNDESTRTEYSGKDENDRSIVKTSQYERVDWVEGTDRIRILCEAAEGKSDPSEKTATYVVTGVHTGSEKQKSEAGLEPADDNSLQWGTGSHTFYAVYPALGMESNYPFVDKTVTVSEIEPLSNNRAKITGVIPSSQEVYKVGTEYKANMNYAYMFATATVDPGTARTVVLPFKPLVTAVEVMLKAGDAAAEGLKLKGASLETESAPTGTALTGDFEATVLPDASYTLSATSNTGRRIDISIAEADRVLLNQDDMLKFTFLALAQDQTGMTLVFTFDKDGEEVQRRLSLRTDRNADGIVGEDEWITVEAGKKIYVRSLGVPGDVWHYTIEEVEDIMINGRAAGSGTSHIRTYRTSGTTSEYVPVTFQYSADGVNYVDGLPSGGLAGLNSLEMSAGSSSLEKTLTAGVGAHEEIAEITQENEIIDHAEIMKTRAAKGSASDPYDLSMHTVTGETRTKPVTANSYVVDAPGTYCFPLVYGNAIDYTKNTNIDATSAGGGNTRAYQASASSTPFTSYVRFDGNEITRPYILWDISKNAGDGSSNYVWNVSAGVPRYELVVLWQDVSEDQVIISKPVTIKQFGESDPNHPLGHDVIYAVFTIDETEIDYINYKVKGAHQGNIVIALRVAAADGITVAGKSWPKNTILWSWQIWVTDNDMSPVRVKTNGSAVRDYNDMLPYHLGWCDETVFNLTRYKTRTWYVKATQASGEPDPKSVVFKVVQNGDVLLEQIHSSASTCYQWGRKDPILPGFNKFTGTSYGDTLPDEFNPTNKPWSSPSGYNIVGAEGYAAVAANMTLDQAIRNPHLFNAGDFTKYNLWNANAASSPNEDRAVVKTAYDPCPPGYSLPHMWAFSNFTTQGTNAIVGDLQLEQTHAADVDGDGVLTEQDFLKNDGWYFYTGYGTETVFFPATCARVDREAYIRYFHVAYLWTAARANNDASNGGFDLFYSQSGSEAWSSGCGHALTVHPVAE